MMPWHPVPLSGIKRMGDSLKNSKNVWRLLEPTSGIGVAQGIQVCCHNQ